MKEINKAEYARQKQAEIKKMTDIAEKGIKSAMESDQFKKYLRMQAKMPRYSVNNCMLIYLQSGGKASQVASYSTWKALGRQVMKGEKGYQIFCPAPFKKEIEVERKDINGKTVIKDGKPVMEKAEVQRMGFKPAYVFDVSATAGADLPEPVTKLKGDVQGFNDLMRAIKMSSPVPIMIGEIKGNANGVYYPTKRQIVVSDKLEPLQQIKTTLHELSHAYLDVYGKDAGKSKAEKETEAEAISFVLTNNILGDQVTPEMVGEYSFGYLATWGDDQLTEFKKSVDTIQKESGNILYRIEKNMNQIIAERQQTQTENQKSEFLNTAESYHKGIHM